MKNTSKLFAVASLFILASCSETKVEETQTTPPVTTETTIIKTEPAKTTKAPETKSTEISIGPDGTKIESKDGKSETKVEVTKDKAGVVIKR